MLGNDVLRFRGYDGKFHKEKVVVVVYMKEGVIRSENMVHEILYKRQRTRTDRSKNSERNTYEKDGSLYRKSL